MRVNQRNRFVKQFEIQLLVRVVTGIDSATNRSVVKGSGNGIAAKLEWARSIEVDQTLKE